MSKKGRKKFLKQWPKLTFEQHRAVIEDMAAHADEYAGIPLPFNNLEIIVHPSYKFASVFKKKQPKDDSG